MLRFILKIGLNLAALYIAKSFILNFRIDGGVRMLLETGILLALLNVLVRPILKLVSTPLIWLTFGLFNLVINMAILWLADRLLAEITITGWAAYVWVSLITSLANII